MNFAYNQELEFIKIKIYEAAELLKGVFDVREKAARDVVTSNDLAVETLLSEAILGKFPEDIVISEETSIEVRHSHRAWVIDPIDGTTNYSRGIPMYGIQLAFVVDQVTTFSLIYYVKMDEMYVAIRNQGAYCNDRLIHVGDNIELDQAIVTLGDFSTTNEFRNGRMLTLMRELMSQVYKLRLHSTACIDLLFLASGKTDVHVMSANHPWDFLPGLLLVREAGGIVDMDLLNHLGDKRTLMVVASTQELYDLVHRCI